jgi:hypothetical protein
MYRLRFLVLVGMTLAAAASRLIPHPPNFAPIGAIALFGGVASPTGARPSSCRWRRCS